MFIIDKTETRLEEAKSNETALSPVCAVHVQNIFAQLHAKAVQAAAAKNVVIENTAADGNDAKNAVFHSAGEHMIVARSAKEGKKITKKDALEGIKAYIGVFCGEDVKKSIKDDECFMLPDGGDEDADDAGDAESMSESFGGFRSYLAKHGVFEAEEDADEAGSNEAGDEAGSDEAGDEAGSDEAGDEAGSDETGDAAGSDEDADEADDMEDPDEAGSSDDGDEAGDDEAGDDETGGGDKDPKPGHEPDDAKAAGWYVLYGLKIKGLKETTIADALKQWGSNFLKGFGVRLIDGWGASGGELHTVGKLVKNLGKLFGAITDPSKLASEIEDKFKKKFPSLQFPSVGFRDKKTLLSDLEKTHREGFDGKAKQKINSADYSLYIHVQKDDPKKPFLNRKIVANIVTMSISGLFKKFKHRVSADDVIYLRGAELDKTGYDSDYRSAVVPSPDDLLKKIKSASGDSLDAWTAIDSLFGKITRNKRLQNDEVAKSFRDLWTKFKKDHGGKSSGVKDFSDYRNFVDDYSAAYSKDKSMSEGINSNISDIFDMLFENGSISSGVLAALGEADTANSGGDVKPEDAKSAANSANSGEAAKNAAKPAEEKPVEKAAENTAASTSGDDADGDGEDDEGGAPEQSPDGDDLYIIPMPGVKPDDTDEDGFSGTL